MTRTTTRGVRFTEVVVYAVVSISLFCCNKKEKGIAQHTHTDTHTHTHTTSSNIILFLIKYSLFLPKAHFVPYFISLCPHQMCFLLLLLLLHLWAVWHP